MKFDRNWSVNNKNKLQEQQQKQKKIYNKILVKNNSSFVNMYIFLINQNPHAYIYSFIYKSEPIFFA